MRRSNRRNGSNTCAAARIVGRWHWQPGACKTACTCWLRRCRRRARRRSRRRWAVSLALAAGLFVALSLRLDWRGRPAEPKSNKSEVIVKKTPAPPAVDSPTLRESAAEMGGAVVALTSQTADETMGQTRWLVPRVSSPALPRVDLESIEPPTRPLREAGESLSAGLEPVTNSARRAVDLFLRELPPMETVQKGL